MSNLKKVIIILAVILLIAIIALVVMLSMGNNTENVQVANQVDVPEQEKQASLTPVKSREDFYTIKESIGKYYSYYSILFNASTYYATEDEQVIAQAEKDNGQILYNMLDSTYITSKGITVDTLKANLTKIGQVTPYITGMYLVPNTGYLSIYVIEGKIKESVEDTGTNFEIIVKLDRANKTFSIMPQEYIVEKYGTIIKEQNTDIMIFSSLTSACQIIAMTFPLANRMGLFFAVPTFLLLPNIIENEFDNQSKRLCYLFIMIISIAFFALLLYQDVISSATLVPYEFIW